MNTWGVKRVFTCTFVALLSGVLSAYLGSQISLAIHRQKCQNQPWGLKTVCQTWGTPGAIWQGGTTGFGLGSILGGVAIALATSKIEDRTQRKTLSALTLQADQLELTTEQRELLRRFLMLIVLKLASDADVDSISLEELQRLLVIAKQQHLIAQDITLTDVEQLLKTSRLSEPTPPKNR